MSNLNAAEKQALYSEAFELLEHVQTLLLNARAQHERDQKEQNLCYPTQVSQVGKPLC